MPRREYTAEEYKFGFGGQLADIDAMNEVYSYKFREYNAKINKFISIDPLQSKYVWNSPFCFAENRVIDGNDLEGLEYDKKTDNNGNITSFEYKGLNDDGSAPLNTVSHVAYKTSISEIVLTASRKGKSHKVKGSAENRDYLIINKPDESIESYRSNDNGMVQLPANFNDLYSTYNQSGNDNWGPVKGVASLINSAADYQKSYPAELISIGDMNSQDRKAIPLGGSSSHHGGTFQVDMRFLSLKGGSVQGDFQSMQFDPVRSKDFFNIMKSNGFNTVLLHPTPAMDISETAIQIIPDRGHYNHYHFQGFNNR